MRRLARLLSALCVFGLVSSTAFAHPEVIRCLAPEVPITDLPEAVLAEYRAEIAAEFEAYFADLSDHIACLDTERSRALSEARVATEAYSAFLNIPPAQKDLP
jgi:methionine-rich copper-binding protein CopC